MILRFTPGAGFGKRGSRSTALILPRTKSPFLLRREARSVLSQSRCQRPCALCSRACGVPKKGSPWSFRFSHHGAGSSFSSRSKRSTSAFTACGSSRETAPSCPPSALLDLHLALHLRRRVNADQQVDFLGRSWPIAYTKRSAVSLIHHPQRQFWVVAHAPLPPKNSWPEILGKYSL